MTSDIPNPNARYRLFIKYRMSNWFESWQTRFQPVTFEELERILDLPLYRNLKEIRVEQV